MFASPRKETNKQKKNISTKKLAIVYGIEEQPGDKRRA
jgi:hypothetical protein